MKPKAFSQWEPDPISEMLGTRMNRFVSSIGVDGLAREEDEGDRITILAIHSRVIGVGLFRAFIADLKRHYKTICIWHEMNPVIGIALSRYGFTAETEILGDGEKVDGWRWDASKTNP
jgi:hypothetical protein